VNVPAPAILTARSAEFFTAELCHITELSNSPADEALSVALARVEPGVTTRWHRLRGIDERYVILAGHGVMELGGLPPLSVALGDVVVIPAGCRQRITNDGAGDLLFHALCTPRFRPEAYEDLEGA
jgi:mannose-6-phosphate isomerase-like protein (cupin superfamily)